jgi:hypothetical protein
MSQILSLGNLTVETPGTTAPVPTLGLGPVQQIHITPLKANKGVVYVLVNGQTKTTGLLRELMPPASGVLSLFNVGVAPHDSFSTDSFCIDADYAGDGVSVYVVGRVWTAERTPEFSMSVHSDHN